MRHQQPIADSAIVAGVTLVVAAILRIDLVGIVSTPAGGDGTAHVLWADVMRKHVFPSGRVSGWSMDWFAGFPVGRFYYPVPASIAAILALVLPFMVAFKVLMVSGAVLLPIAVYLLLRGVGAEWPTPALGSVFSLVFLLFEPGRLVFGGTFQSVLAGELAYSLALSLGLVGVGALASYLRRGAPRRWVAAVLIGAAVGSHLVIGVWVLALSVVVAGAHGRHGLARTVPVGLAAVGLTGVWLVPLIAELGMVTDPGFPVVSGAALVPSRWWWVLVLAGLGLVVSLRRSSKTGRLLAGWLGITGLLILGLPSGLVVSNARLLPLWNLGLAVSAAVGIAAGSRVLRGWVQPVAVGGLTSLILIGGFFGSTTVRARSSVVMTGLEPRPVWSELDALATALQGLPSGRVAWELFPGLAGYGSPFALQLLPYLTDGHVATLDGLHRESSATYPGVERVLSELSAVGRRTMGGLNYGSLDDFDQGIEHLRLFGVRWYLAASAAAKKLADDHPGLIRVAILEAAAQGGVVSWSIYRVTESVVVEPLSMSPLVIGTDGRDWREVSDDWMVTSGWPERLLAVTGPEDWPRISQTRVVGDQPKVAVTQVEVGLERVGFSVDRLGVPVLIKVSYAPGWFAEGADGPYRVTPNFMVVIPTRNRVEMWYGWTAADRLGVAMSLVSVAGLATLWSLDYRTSGRRES